MKHTILEAIALTMMIFETVATIAVLVFIMGKIIFWQLDLQLIFALLLLAIHYLSSVKTSLQKIAISGIDITSMDINLGFPKDIITKEKVKVRKK